MDLLQLLGFAAGVGFLAGIRLYATVLAVGLAIRFHWLTFGTGEWNILAHPAVMISAGVLGVIELLADKVAWIDTVWDAFHTFIRPIGAILLGAAAFATVDPKWRILLILLCGGMALTSHTSKAATRFAVNHSPEPFSNILVSTAEDVAMPAVMWVALEHPVAMLVFIALFIAGFVWMFRKIVRMVRRRFGWGVAQAA